MRTLVNDILGHELVRWMGEMIEAGSWPWGMGAGEWHIKGLNEAPIRLKS